MLIAVGGAQGSGKSTLLESLRQEGYNVIERKTARSLLADWNCTLQEVYDSPKLHLEFQFELLNRKYIDELNAAHSLDVWFTERTFIDLYVYTLLHFGSNNDYESVLNDYHHRCHEATLKLYSKTFYLTSGGFAVERDGVRSSNFHYALAVDAVMHRFYQTLPHNSVIDTIDLNYRKRYILQYLPS